MSGERPLAPIVINRATLLQIYAHAQEGYPEEVCGFVLAADGPEEESTARRCENRQNALHAEDPIQFSRDARTAYNLGAKDLFFLDRSLRTDRPVRMIYHSHVDVGAYFSEEDARAAAPDGELLYPVDYLVVDVQKESVRGAKLFRFVAGRFVKIGSYGS